MAAKGANSSTVREEIVRVRGIRTPVLKVGKLKENVPDGVKKVLMLVIPGNPGVPYYYEDFMQELYVHCDGQVPVWLIGQAGHLRCPGEAITLSDVFSTREESYGLEAQVAHKVAFIKENIPPDVTVILIGHSIGCYMILNALDDLPQSQVLRCFMLFPTIERMKESPNGIRLTPLFRFLRWLIVLTTYFLCLIPGWLRLQLIRLVYRKVNYPRCMEGAVLETLTPWTTNFATYLAKIEMNKVSKLQEDLIEKHQNKLSFYYGAIDLWCPTKYYHDITKKFPNLDARLCELKLKHAFIMDSKEGQAMAKIIWLWAQSHHRSVFTQENGGESWIFD